MSNLNNICNVNSSAICLNDTQKSLINFFDKHDRGIIEVTRQAGTSTALNAYIAWILLTQKNKNILVVVPNHGYRRNFMQTFSDHFTKVDTSNLIRYNTGLVENSSTNSILRIETAAVMYNIKGITLDYVFFDNFYSQSLATIDDIMQSINPMVNGKMHLINSLYVSINTFTNLPYFKNSNFVLWDDDFEHIIDKLIKL